MKTKNITRILYVIFCIVIVSLVWNLYSNHQNIQVQTCEKSDIMKISVEAWDMEYIPEMMIDYYVESISLNYFYWDRICDDLLEVRLNETLNKSDNFRLHSFGNFIKENNELYCNYGIYWDSVDDYYGKAIKEGIEYFNSVDIVLAQQNRQPKFNKSLISVEWDEDWQETKIRNVNADYDVVLVLKLNNSWVGCKNEVK